MNIQTENHTYQIKTYAHDLLAKIFIKENDTYTYVGTLLNVDKSYIKKTLIEKELTGKPIGLGGKS